MQLRAPCLAALRPAAAAGWRLRQPVRGARCAAAALAAGQQPDFVQLRAAERRRVAVHLFRLVGVSFEGRQEHLAGVAPGDPVMLVREPGNEHDPNAIAVKLLDGVALGYVPRTFTQTLRRSVQFGRVRSVGKAADVGLYGAQIECQPALPPLVAEAVPPQLRERCASVLAGPGPEAHAAALQATQGRCQVSGAQAPQVLLSVGPTWEVDDHAGEVRLVGLQAVAQQLREAQAALLLPGHLDAQTAAAFCAINGWSTEALGAYRRHQMRLLEQREARRWRVVADAAMRPSGGE